MSRIALACTNRRGYPLRQFYSVLKFDPVPRLLSSEDAALRHFAKCELFGERDPQFRVDVIPEVQRIVRKQLQDGSWGGKQAKNKTCASNYGLIETWKALRILVDKYGFCREHPSVEKGAEYAFACQSEEGDPRFAITD